MQGENVVTKPLSSSDIDGLTQIESLFFAYRDFIADADRILDGLNFGRAHHRVLYFVNRKPGMMVAELLDILGITKQSLARVLKELIDSGYISQKTGETDRRQRLLYPTTSGRQLIMELSLPQSRRIKAAMKDIPDAGRELIDQFMINMSDQKDKN